MYNMHYGAKIALDLTLTGNCFFFFFFTFWCMKGLGPGVYRSYLAGPEPKGGEGRATAKGSSLDEEICGQHKKVKVLLTGELWTLLSVIDS